MGRLLDGRTFGIVERRLEPRFGIAREDAEAARELLDANHCRIEPWTWTTLAGTPLLRVTQPGGNRLRRVAEQLELIGVQTYEADIPLQTQYRMDHRITGPLRIRGASRPGRDVDLVFIDPDVQPGAHPMELSVLSLDIETTPDAGMVTAVALVGDGGFGAADVEEVHTLGTSTGADPRHLLCWRDEWALLQSVMDRFRAIDPDLITGWNVIDFDLRVLLERLAALGLSTCLGRSHEEARYTKGQTYGRSRVSLTGRQVLDALHLVRHTADRYDDMRLDTVARLILGRGKTLISEDPKTAAEHIENVRHSDRTAFAEYCLEDARLVRDILRAKDLIEVNQRRSVLTGLPLDRAWGSIAAFDFLYISELHAQHVLAPTLNDARDQDGTAPGGLVLDPVPGLYDGILVFDFRSLYPSVMRTFNVDPYSAARAVGIPQEDCIVAPNGTRFAREQGLLPGILDVFFTERQAAKDRADPASSLVYKLVMNSFYGVLGTPACRFGSPHLAGAITTFGQLLLRWCRDWFRGQGCDVIYGDTDSLFVAPHHHEGTDLDALGARLCTEANAALAKHIHTTYGVRSQLDLEFEKAYTRFLMPHARGDRERGRAKGYAGLRQKGADSVVDIVGMEAVRSDWTDMAHMFQRHLLDRLFAGHAASEIEAFVSDWVKSLLQGKMDAQLVYRRRLRRDLATYTATTPPHVKAARMLDSPGRLICYVMTTMGPQPDHLVGAPLDYGHYIDKQIRPLLDMVAPYCGVDPAAAIRGEQRLF